MNLVFYHMVRPSSWFFLKLFNFKYVVSNLCGHEIKVVKTLVKKLPIRNKCVKFIYKGVALIVIEMGVCLKFICKGIALIVTEIGVLKHPFLIHTTSDFYKLCCNILPTIINQLQYNLTQQVCIYYTFTTTTI